LGQPGQQGAPRRRHLSAYHPDGAGDVPHNLLPERRGRIECVQLWPRSYALRKQGLSSIAFLVIITVLHWRGDHMKTTTTTRLEFITLLGGAAALAWPLGARAQQSSKMWRMGFIARGHETFYDALFEGLRELGYVEGRSLIVERRYAGDRTD